MKIIILVLLGCVGLIVALLLVVLFAFNSRNHAAYDTPKHKSTGMRVAESDEHAAIAQTISAEMAAAPKMGRVEMLTHMREKMDARGDAFEIDAAVTPVVVDGVKAEWVVAPNVDVNRRVLYIHGGGYMVGSPQSHRLMTSRMSAVANAAVLVVDYRLMPEHGRMDGIEDCQIAYEWLLKNGADGAGDADVVIVAGDSSGGNMALAIVAWARDAGLRVANAVVAMSPQTDLTLGSPSLVANVATDVLQGVSFGPIVKAPKVVGLGFSFLMHKVNPRNPIVSPLLGDLSGLPPTLVQASEAEMFLDDAVRYVNKANAQGSPAVLQTWPFMMHVWQAFEVPEADEAFAEMGRFIELYVGE